MCFPASIVQHDPLSATSEAIRTSTTDQEETKEAHIQEDAALKFKSAPPMNLTSSPQSNFRAIRENLKSKTHTHLLFDPG